MLGLPMGGLVGYLALGLDSYAAIGTFIRSTHTVNSIHRQGLMHTYKEDAPCQTHTHKLTYMLVNRSACLLALSV